MTWGMEEQAQAKLAWLASTVMEHQQAADAWMLHSWASCKVVKVIIAGCNHLPLSQKQVQDTCEHVPRSQCKPISHCTNNARDASSPIQGFAKRLHSCTGWVPEMLLSYPYSIM